MKFTEFINTSHFDEYIDSDITILEGGYNFWYGKSITTLTLPNATKINDVTASSIITINAPNVKEIAIQGWNSLTTINAPIENIFKIADCSLLTSMNLTNLKSISSYQFNAPLTSLYLPNLTTLGSGAFGGFSYLKTFDAPNISTVGIAQSIFYNCINLQTVNMPNVKYLYSYTFQGCFKLQSVVLSTEFTYIPSNCFNGCIFIPSIPLETERITTVYTRGFAGCNNLKEASFPTLKTIQSYAFENNYNLMSLYLGSDSVVSLPYSNAFSYTPIAGYWNASRYIGPESQYGSIYVPMSLVDEYKAKTNWLYFSNRIVGI